MSAPVFMYMKSWCPYCQRAAQLLARKNASVEQLDIEVHPERRQEMIERSGRRTVPQIFVDGRHVGGCDDLHALEAAGELDALLAGGASSDSSVQETP